MSDVAPPAAAASHGRAAARLHHPARLVVAVLEVLAAGAAGWMVPQAWARAWGTVVFHLDDGTELVSRTVAGNWVGLAFALATAAALLLVDAGRQTLLGTRTRRRRRGGPGR
ncbi:hypothetical protein [Saccharomonospora halophila]|uniref:hypothetical protein n=1 Tax=Saccharomonospora halophila TaxID=129922 RepID=UPI000381EF72|nr:hypothetical protein [Saccharomonospora halophila]